MNYGDTHFISLKNDCSHELGFPVEVEAKEPLRVAVNGERSMDGGLYQAFLDGVTIGQRLDFCADKTGEMLFPLLDFWPDPGIYVLRLECVGRNPRSTGAACAIESVRFIERRPRVAEWAHDEDKGWREKPILYE